jgi:hypothetical protein
MAAAEDLEEDQVVVDPEAIDREEAGREAVIPMRHIGEAGAPRNIHFDFTTDTEIIQKPDLAIWLFFLFICTYESKKAELLRLENVSIGNS